MAHVGKAGDGRSLGDHRVITVLLQGRAAIGARLR